MIGNAGRDDWILCQITSKPYGDPSAVKLTVADFASGTLRIESYARPGKLFTANERLILSSVGVLSSAKLESLTAAVAQMIRSSP